MNVDRWFMRALPKPLWPWIGRWRGFYWGVVRSETAQRRHIATSYRKWSGTVLHPDDLEGLIEEQRPTWRRNRDSNG